MGCQPQGPLRTHPQIRARIKRILMSNFNKFCGLWWPNNFTAMPNLILSKIDQFENNWQGVKWEDTSKKEEKEDIFLEKEDKKRTFFFKLNTTEEKKT